MSGWELNKSAEPLAGGEAEDDADASRRCRSTDKGVPIVTVAGVVKMTGT